MAADNLWEYRTVEQGIYVRTERWLSMEDYRRFLQQPMQEDTFEVDCDPGGGRTSIELAVRWLQELGLTRYLDGTFHRIEEPQVKPEGYVFVQVGTLVGFEAQDKSVIAARVTANRLRTRAS